MLSPDSNQMDKLQLPQNSSAETLSILTPEAIDFVSELISKFAPPLSQLLEQRKTFQSAVDAGQLPDFLPETQSIRDGDWKVKEIPEILQNRRVEITGPVDRKMIINALNAEVKVFMADFEDSLAPTWEACMQGQINLRDAVDGSISFNNPVNGKQYQLNPDPALLLCRVRGLHLEEKHVSLRGKRIPAALLDFGLYFFHNQEKLIAAGSGPYFYIPKLQSHQEAGWWSDVFHFAEDKFDLEHGTIKATVLIETLPAVFQMDEILYAMRDHIAALNCGRWDYIFSYIKTLKNFPDRVLPDRQIITMEKPFLRSYSRLLVNTCHRRGALAMGGMAALIPAKDPQLNAQILEKVRIDKQLEADNGHDGTWIAHPGLAKTAMDVFDQGIAEGRNNNLHVLHPDSANTTAADLLEPCEGERTEEGMRANIRVAVQYLEAWLGGVGCVPIYGLMEDAATAEISRASIWQWIRHEKSLSNGKKVTVELFRTMLEEETKIVAGEIGEQRYNNGHFPAAIKLMDEITTAETLVDFLTLPAYEQL